MCRSIFVLYLFALVTTGFGQSEPAPVAEFGSAGEGLLSFRIERIENGGRRGQLWTTKRSLTGVLIFRKEQWAELAKTCLQAINAAGALLSGQMKTVAELATSGAGLLRLDVAEHHDHTFLRFTRLDGPGGNYPPITVELSQADFSKLQKALDSVTVELNRK